MATIGKNILDNLTTGMYSDSKVIYREYIQNACDQIDLAIKTGILSQDDGRVEIYTDFDKRYISIKDNATGVKAGNFRKSIGDIANSDKEIGENKGFRGIGRLCGLAYCKTLKFSTSYSGESVKSIMTCDALKMRSMLQDKTKYTLDEVWDAIITFSTEYEKAEEHYFEVEMFDINKENTDLLNESKVREYLSFVSPVPYKNTFILRSQIYEYAKSINYVIDEYCITVNGVQIFKAYTTNLKEQKGASEKTYDHIHRLQFKDFRDKYGNLIAWMWFGLSRFEKQIPSINQMRGIRLRSANIQIGNDDTLQFLFKENRGNYYFIGEVFAVSKDLIPNSQRDYFNENETRVLFETILREYFYDVLHKLYYEANRFKGYYQAQEDYVNKVNEYKEKEKNHGFVNKEEHQKLQYEIDKLKKKAEDARKHIDKSETSDSTSPFSYVRGIIRQKYESENQELPPLVDPSNENDTDSNKPSGFITDRLSRLPRNDRKLVGKILTIIINMDIVPKDILNKIIEKIIEELNSTK